MVFDHLDLENEYVMQEHQRIVDIGSLPLSSTQNEIRKKIQLTAVLSDTKITQMSH